MLTSGYSECITVEMRASPRMPAKRGSLDRGGTAIRFGDSRNLKDFTAITGKDDDSLAVGFTPCTARNLVKATVKLLLRPFAVGNFEELPKTALEIRKWQRAADAGNAVGSGACKRSSPLLNCSEINRRGRYRCSRKNEDRLCHPVNTRRRRRCYRRQSCRHRVTDFPFSMNEAGAVMVVAAGLNLPFPVPS